MKETQAFLANLGAQCALKKKEWAERQSMRAEEVAESGGEPPKLLAISEHTGRVQDFRGTPAI